MSSCEKGCLVINHLMVVIIFDSFALFSDETYHPASKGYGTRKNQTVMVTRSSSRKRIPTFKAKAELLVKKEKRSAPPPPPAPSPPPPPMEPTQVVKRKRGRPPKVRPEPANQEGKDAPQSSKLTPQDPWGTALTSNGLMNSVELVWKELFPFLEDFTSFLFIII